MKDRRHMTDLTDDEVALFDAMWDGDCAFWMLQRAHYQAVTDLPYTHGLDDLALIETLKRLTERGLVRSYLYVYAETDDRRYFGLTPEGGAFWELERKPDWDTFCYSSERGTRWFVESPSKETANAFAQWAFDAGWGASHRDQLTLIEKPNYRFLTWYDFPVVYELSGVLQPKTYRLDWDTYHERRTWWLDIPELLDWHLFR